MTTATLGRPATERVASLTHHRTTSVDTGHFAFEDKADVIVPLIRDFLERRLTSERSNR